MTWRDEAVGKPWEGMDCEDSGSDEWREGLTDAQVDEWHDWQERARREEFEDFVGSAHRSWSGNEADAAYDQAAVGMQQGAGTRVSVAGLAEGMAAATTPFTITATTAPPADGGPPPSTVEATLTSASGGRAVVTLYRLGDREGRIIYRTQGSNSLQSLWQAESVDSLFGFGWTSGGKPSKLGIAADDIVTITVDGSSTWFRAFEDDRDLALELQAIALQRAGEHFVGLRNTYQREADPSDPAYEHNLSILGRAVRTAQLGQDHLRDERLIKVGQIAQANHYLSRLPFRAAEELATSGWIRDPFGYHDIGFGDHRSSQYDHPALVKSAALTSGLAAQDQAWESIKLGFARDLTTGAVDYVADGSGIKLIVPLLNEGKDHHGRSLTAEQWVAMGFDGGLRALKVTKALRGARAAGAGRLASGRPPGPKTSVDGALEEAATWLPGKRTAAVKSAVVTAATGVKHAVQHQREQLAPLVRWVTAAPLVALAIGGTFVVGLLALLSMLAVDPSSDHQAAEVLGASEAQRSDQDGSAASGSTAASGLDATSDAIPVAAATGGAPAGPGAAVVSAPVPTPGAGPPVAPSERVGEGFFITGLVWDDHDGDGNRRPIDAAVAGVTVELLDHDAGGVVLESQVTGTDGFYRFDLSQRSIWAEYLVRVTRPGGRAFSSPGRDSHVDPFTGTSLWPITLSPRRVDAGLTAPASIGDRVWWDLDLDGIQDRHEPGVAGARVALQYDHWHSRSRPPLETAADEHGHYRFDGLPPGRYRVQFHGEGWTRWRAGSDRERDSDARERDGSTTVISLGTGESRPDIDAGLVPPVAEDGWISLPEETLSGSILGLVWNDVDADGVRGVGEPHLAGIVVRLLDATDLGTLAETTTDEMGFYAFSPIAFGSYRIEVVATEPFVFTRPRAGSNAGRDSDVNEHGLSVDTVDVTLFSERVDAGLTTRRIGDRVWFDADGDGVQDEDEQGMAGVTVELRHDDRLRSAVRDPLSGEPWAVTTAADGGYLFEPVRAGSYVVYFTLPSGFTFTKRLATEPRESSDDSDAVSDGSNFGFTRSFAVGTTFTLDIDAGAVTAVAEPPPVTDPPGEINGVVWHDLDADGERDLDEPRLAGVSVWLRPGPFGTWDDVPDVIAVTVTNELGEYHFPSLPPGTYTVEVDRWSPGGPDHLVFTFQNRAGVLEALDSDVDASGYADAAVGPGDAAWVDAGLITRRIGDRAWIDTNCNGIQDEGEPGLEGVEIALHHFDGGEVLDADGKPVRAVTDADGAYLLDPVPAGTFQLAVQLPSGYAFTEQLDPDPLSRGDDSDLTPVGIPTSGFTRRFELDTAFTLDVDFGAVPWSNPTARLDLRSFRDVDGDGLHGGDEPGGPAGLGIALSTPDGIVLDEAVTDESGAVSFTEVMVGGPYVVRFDRGEHERLVLTDPAGDSEIDPVTLHSAPFDLTEEGHTVTIGLAEGAIVGGVVCVDPGADGCDQGGDDTPVEGIAVRLLDEHGEVVVVDGGALADAATDAFGLYELPPVRPGRYLLAFSGVDPARRVSGVELDESGRTPPFDLDAGEDLSADLGLAAHQPDPPDPPDEHEFDFVVEGSFANSAATCTALHAHSVRAGIASVFQQVTCTAPIDFVGGSTWRFAGDTNMGAICQLIAESATQWTCSGEAPVNVGDEIFHNIDFNDSNDFTSATGSCSLFQGIGTKTGTCRASEFVANTESAGGVIPMAPLPLLAAAGARLRRRRGSKAGGGEGGI